LKGVGDTEGKGVEIYRVEEELERRERCGRWVDVYGGRGR